MRNKLYLGFVVLLFIACGGKKDQEKIIPPVSADKLKTDRVIGIASIEPADRIVQLTTESAGVVKTIHAQVSQQVKKGDLLFSLSDEVEAAQVNQAQSKLRTQQSIIESQQATVGSLEVQLQNAKTNYERTQKLFNGNAATQQQLDDSRFALENVTQQKLSASANLQQQIAKKAELQADLNYNQSLFNRKHIRATANGTILSIDAKVGNYVNSGTALCEFAPEGALIAITEIDELFADRVKFGQQAMIRPQGDSIILAKGEVYIISPYLKKKSLFSDNASNLEDRRVREVRVKINPDATLLIGSRVECVIELK
jgi:multidrug resistance efflux pump